MDKYKKIGFRTNERIEEYLDELCRLTVWLCAVADLKHKTLNNR